MLNEQLRPRKYVYWALLFLPVALYLFTAIVPMFYSFYYGLFKWSGGPKMVFIGLRNFEKLLRDSIFWESVGNNLYIVVACILGQIGIAMVLSMLMSTRYARLKGLHRTLCYFPMTISVVVVGFVWSMLYDYNYGFINGFLDLIGRTDLKQPWLANPKLALPLVCLPLVWQCIGYYMVIILAALTSLDKGVLEMAEIDGATEWQKFCHITLPLLRPTLSVMITLCISGNMKAFDHIYVMTSGGPGSATSVMALYAYNMSFLRNNMGYGNAISVGILIVSVSVILITKMLERRISGEEV